MNTPADDKKAKYSHNNLWPSYNNILALAAMFMIFEVKFGMAKEPILKNVWVYSKITFDNIATDDEQS